jgi:hypothetical protein
LKKIHQPGLNNWGREEDENKVIHRDVNGNSGSGKLSSFD